MDLQKQIKKMDRLDFTQQDPAEEIINCWESA